MRVCRAVRPWYAALVRTFVALVLAATACTPAAVATTPDPAPAEPAAAPATAAPDPCTPLPREEEPCHEPHKFCVVDWGSPGGHSTALWCRDGKWEIEHEANLPDEEG